MSIPVSPHILHPDDLPELGSPLKAQQLRVGEGGVKGTTEEEGRVK